MAYISIPHVKISGISACVPKQIDENLNSPVFSPDNGSSFIKTTGIERRRKADSNICASDLCLASVEKLLIELEWKKEEIDCLIFVSQTPDYHLPATACILQERLGLSTGCYALDISFGCSGWVYALSVISSLLSTGSMKKGLLLAGDTPLKFCSEKDKSTYPLFGDAGSCTALEYQEDAKSLFFDMHTDGSGYKSIIIEDGGYRNQVKESSFMIKRESENIELNKLQLVLDGMDVFSFGISRAPESVNNLLTHFHLEKNFIDYFVFHQANKFMNEKIRKKLGLETEKVPYSLKDFGNTSCVTIPLTMVYNLRNQMLSEALSFVGCGFGVGLSWASVYFQTHDIVVPDLLEI